ncbi:MAG: TatD family hydrolase [Candidatus Micrarchaeaceae archaeon]
MYIDAHCHLNLFSEPKKTIIDSAASGVSMLVCSGDSAKDCAECISLADMKYVFATIGIGPDFACKDAPFVNEIKQIALANKKKVVGIGEIGLDVHTADSGICNMHSQESVFTKQIEVANGLGLPIVVHSRGTIDRVIEIVHKERPAKAMFHFFEGNEAQAKELADEGYIISVPPFLDKRRKKIISLLDINNIAVETDSPVAGKSPAEIVKLVDEIAKIKNLDKEAVANGIAQTIRNLFGI